MSEHDPVSKISGTGSSGAESAGAESAGAESSGAESAGRAARRLRWQIFAGLTALLVAITAIAVLANHFGSLPAADPNAKVAAGVVDQPASSTPECAALDAALPAEIATLTRREMAVNEPGVAAWGEPPVVMRCGLADPLELTCSSSLEVLNAVAWFALTDPDSRSTTFIAVDRAVRVALTVDNSQGVGPVQAFSNVLAKVLPERAVCNKGVLNPTVTP
ncbi:DUF3515 domain-containing protein [Nakamurella antarctica]|uniref:DUF3515 domain-containing protein n=1 Tax=Nakamurella antarctica TaxID=1902245 RepID=A0A3G8ZMV1_9ACTN|nr:DUF3515 domain-containing protein [Nakamurella antarctica]AZI58468.1 DUF3515 domain-containing protein [Nakamurella antarctica]